MSDRYSDSMLYAYYLSESLRNIIDDYIMKDIEKGRLKLTKENVADFLEDVNYHLMTEVYADTESFVDMVERGTG